jgi:enamine deaminase RidA (YjgF/YER057c/UK114 family)
MKRVLEEVGATLENLVEVTVFLKNMEDYPEFNKVHPPTCIDFS